VVDGISVTVAVIGTVSGTFDWSDSLAVVIEAELRAAADLDFACLLAAFLAFFASVFLSFLWLF
jgi:hypothetical protein